jgi:hypothetical protein
MHHTGTSGDAVDGRITDFIKTIISGADNAASAVLGGLQQCGLSANDNSRSGFGESPGDQQSSSGAARSILPNRSVENLSDADQHSSDIGKQNFTVKTKTGGILKRGRPFKEKAVDSTSKCSKNTKRAVQSIGNTSSGNSNKVSREFESSDDDK